MSFVAKKCRISWAYCLKNWYCCSRCRESTGSGGLAHSHEVEGCRRLPGALRVLQKVAAPLFALTKKDKNFAWNEECQLAYDKLKVALTTAPILSLPVEGATYVL